jgi:transcription elongation factor GreA
MGAGATKISARARRSIVEQATALIPDNDHSPVGPVVGAFLFRLVSPRPPPHTFPPPRVLAHRGQPPRRRDALEQAKKNLTELIHARIKGAHWTKLNDDWKQVIAAAPPLDINFHRDIIERLINKQEDHLRPLYEPLLAALQSNEEHVRLASQIIEELLRQNTAARQKPGGTTRDLEWVRQPLLAVLPRLYKDAAERIDALITKSGLRDTNLSIVVCLQKFDDMLGARPNKVFQHSAWGVGVVDKVDLATGKVTLNFRNKKGQEMTLEGVRNFLRPLPDTHLRAQIATNRAGIRELISSDPAAVLRLAAQSYGRSIKVADLKKILLDDFLTESEYKSFWERARSATKVASDLEMVGSGANAEIRLREKPLSFFDEVITRFMGATSAAQRREVLRDVRNHQEKAQLTDDDRNVLRGLFSQPLQSGAISSRPERLKHGILAHEFADLLGDAAAGLVDVDALLRGEDIVELIAQLESHEGRRFVLERLLALRESEWGEIFVESVLSLDARTVAWAEKEAETRGHAAAFHTALERILAKPDANPDLFLWIARQLLSADAPAGKDKKPAARKGTATAPHWASIREGIPPVLLIDEVLSLLAEIHELGDSVEGARNQATRLRAFLSDGNCAFFKRAVENSSIEEARRLLNVINLHNGLSAQLKASLEAILISKHGDLRRFSRQEEEQERLRPPYHYTTANSLEAKRAELSRILQVEVPAATQAIAIAKEHGDLRENAEYHAAKDRQKTLMQMAAELEDLIARARVVEPRDVTPESIRFGTRVHLRNLSDGSDRIVTVLGMWEAKPEEGIISYLTPFGKQLQGRRVGDTIVSRSQDGVETSYEVLSIEMATF